MGNIDNLEIGQKCILLANIYCFCFQTSTYNTCIRSQISHWSCFRAVSKYTQKTKVCKQPTFRMGSRAESIFSSLGLGEEEVGVYDAEKQAFEEYFSPSLYVNYKREKLFSRVQICRRAVNESTDRCEFPDRATQIRDRIVIGMRDQTVSREIQRMDIAD